MLGFSPLASAPLGDDGLVIFTLSASNVQTSAPTVGVTSVTQLHNLTASDVSSGAPTLGAPTITQNHAVVASLTGANPTVGSPAITQVHALTTSDVTSEAVVIANIGLITQDHAFTALDIISGSVLIDNTEITENHIFNGSITTTPTIANSTIEQVHLLTGNNCISGTSLVDPLNMAEGETFLGTNVITLSFVINNLTLVQHHSLTISDTITNAISIETSDLNQIHDLSLNNLSTGEVQIGLLGIDGNQILPTLNIVTGAVILNSSNLNQNHDFVGLNLNFNAPTINNSTIDQIHILNAFDLTTTSTNIDLTDLDENNSFVGNTLTVTPIIDITTIQQNHEISSTDFVLSSVVNTTTIEQEHNLNTINIITSAVDIGISSTVAITALTGSNIVTGNGIVGSPVTVNDWEVTADNLFNTTVDALYLIEGNNEGYDRFRTPSYGPLFDSVAVINDLTVNSTGISFNLTFREAGQNPQYSWYQIGYDYVPVTLNWSGSSPMTVGSRQSGTGVNSNNPGQYTLYNSNDVDTFNAAIKTKAQVANVAHLLYNWAPSKITISSPGTQNHLSYDWDFHSQVTGNATNRDSYEQFTPGLLTNTIQFSATANVLYVDKADTTETSSANNNDNSGWTRAVVIANRFLLTTVEPYIYANAFNSTTGWQNADTGFAVTRFDATVYTKEVIGSELNQNFNFTITFAINSPTISSSTLNQNCN